ncbi:GIY-YIG nuclease family protein [Arenibacter sp. ARW7G5Y1]|uniref:GIY-YIG nuclease family protein n=1 Tax=Arenibacter sp. ARW7G5Y1 TaxID=2135619 RepID=UPI001C646C05
MFVYILYSEKRSKYYVGQTADIERRLKRHNQGVVPFTKSGTPWKLFCKLKFYHDLRHWSWSVK